MSVEWKQEIKISSDLRTMIRNCQDKRGLGMVIAKEMDKQNELTVTAIRGKLTGTLLRRRTGNLSLSIGLTDALVIADAAGGEVRSSVGSGVGTAGGQAVKYAAPLEFGSKEHPITAKKAPFLVFMGKDGHLIRKKEVWHPGNRAYRYVRGTVEERLPRYATAVGNAAFNFIRGAQ